MSERSSNTTKIETDERIAPHIVGICQKEVLTQQRLKPFLEKNDVHLR